jgi:glycosyltransferase involved in cell wall biosynthesis
MMLSEAKSAPGRVIGIDVSSIPYGTGVSNYTQNLVRNLLKIDKINSYKLFFSSLRQPLPKEISEYSSHPNVKIYHFRLPPTLLEILWNRLHWFPIELFIGQCDIFHTWDWTQPPTKKALTVTTIHDFVPLLFPETQHSKTISVFTKKLFWAGLECSHFICVSQNTRTDLLKLFPKISTSKISVIYEAAEDKYDQFQKLSPEEKKKKIAVIYRQYGLKKFILAQGTREPRKNLDRLVSAFQLFKSNNPQSKVELAISGKYGWGKDISPPTDSSIKILGYIPEKDMVALHASALCLCYPSLYEGFGLPVVKSMKVGTPVITSNISSLPEVAGQAALLVNPTNTQEIAMAIERVANSPSLCRQLVNKGYRQSKQFSWVKTAQETLKLYKKLCSSE